MYWKVMVFILIIMHRPGEISDSFKFQCKTAPKTRNKKFSERIKLGTYRLQSPKRREISDNYKSKINWSLFQSDEIGNYLQKGRIFRTNQHPLLNLSIVLR